MLSAKYCMVTGGNTGVGKETVKVRFARAGVIVERLSTLFILIQALLKHNAKVYLAARTETKANAAIADLKNETGKEAIFLQLDLADLTAVRRSAEEFLSFVPFSGVSTEISLTILSERRVSCRFLSITRTWLSSVHHVITRGNEMAAWTTAA
jgi:NAD(P)-dependent dehydrogenase (short-subunit alcohol dehydrogenase family)